MLGRNEALQVDAWLYGGGSKRPHLATRLLLQMEAAARSDTGDVLYRVREGCRVCVFLNSRLATAGLPEGEHEAAQAAERPAGVQLELIESGAPAVGS